MGYAADPVSEAARKALRVWDLTPAIDTNAYANGDVLGALMMLSSVTNANGLGAFLHSITVIDRNATPQNTAMSFVFFSEEPTASTFTNNAAVVIAAADEGKILGVVPIAEADYFPVGAATSVASARGVGLSLQCGDGGNDIWVAAIANEAGTYGAATDLIFRFGMQQG